MSDNRIITPLISKISPMIEQEDIFSHYKTFTAKRGDKMSKSSEKHVIPFWKQDRTITCPFFGYPTCNYSPRNKDEKDYMWEKIYRDIMSDGSELKDPKKKISKKENLELVGQI